MDMNMSVRIHQVPSLTQEMSMWLWEAYVMQSVVEWNNVQFKVTNIETVNDQLIVELTPVESDDTESTRH